MPSQSRSPEQSMGTASRSAGEGTAAGSSGAIGNDQASLAALHELVALLGEPEPDPADARALFASLAPVHRASVMTDHELMPKMAGAMSGSGARDAGQEHPAGLGGIASTVLSAARDLVEFEEQTNPAVWLAARAASWATGISDAHDEAPQPAPAPPQVAAPAPGGPVTAAPTARVSVESAVDPGRAVREDALRREAVDGGGGSNLDAAVDLVGKISAPHRNDMAKTDPRIAAADDRSTGNKHLLREGDFSSIQAINCGEFTSAAMYASGYALNEKMFRDPVSGLPVAYKEGSGAHRVVTADMLVNMQPEATSAILAAQHQDARISEVTAEEITTNKTKFGGKIRLAEGYLLFDGGSSEDFDAIAHVKGDVFGAAAAALAFGGVVVDVADRMPGDVQQREAVDTDGTYNVRTGHSATVHTVFGSGVVYLGAAGAKGLPVVTGPPPAVAGWYDVSDGTVALGPDTMPEFVASFKTSKATFVEANIAKAAGTEANGQAARITKSAVSIDDENAMVKGSASKPVEDQSAFSVGRLPGSRWFGWAASTPAGPVGGYPNPPTQPRLDEQAHAGDVRARCRRLARTRVRRRQRARR